MNLMKETKNYVFYISFTLQLILRTTGKPKFTFDFQHNSLLE